jgi:hypothetical protein
MRPLGRKDLKQRISSLAVSVYLQGLQAPFRIDFERKADVGAVAAKAHFVRIADLLTPKMLRTRSDVRSG